MPLSAAEFLEIVERKHLAAPAVVASLRTQVAAANRPVNAAVLGKYLVDKGHVSADIVRAILATEQPPTTAAPEIGLFGAAAAESGSPLPTAEQVRAHLSPPGPRGSPAATAPPAKAAVVEEELGLAPDEDEEDRPARPATPAKSQPAARQPAAPVVPVAPARPAAPFSADELGLAPDEDDGPRARVAAAPVKAVPVKAAPVKVAPVKAVPVTAAPIKAVPVQAVPVQAVPAKGVPVTPVQVPKPPAQASPAKGLPASVVPSHAGTAPTGGAPPAGQRVRPPAAAPAAAKPMRQPGTKIVPQAPGRPQTKPTSKPAASATPAPARPLAPQPVSGPLDLLDELGSGLSPAGSSGNLPGEVNLGELDLIDGDPLTGGGLDSAPLSSSARRPARGSLTRKQQLLIGGGSAAGVVVALAVVLAVVSLKGNGEPEFAAAEKDFQAQANSAAVTKYQDFLERFRRHPRTAAARVHLGVARLRVATANQHDWPSVLNQIPGILDPIVGQDEFRDGQAEVATLLTRIAEALTENALKTMDAAEGRQRIQTARQALALANQPRYVRAEKRDWQLLETLAERLTLQEYQLERGDALDHAAAELAQALAAHDLAAAFAARQQLVEKYPDQARARRWLEPGRAIAAEARGQVKIAERPRPASTEELATPVEATFVLGDAGPPLSGSEPAPVFALSQGAVYALDAANGQILWRRFTGTGSPRPPLTIDGGADVLVVDSRDDSLLRVAAATGKLRWRQTVGAPLVDPVAVGERVFVATRTGLVLSLDAATGEVAAQVQLPQALDLALIAEPAGKALYALAEHSNLYSLATADLSCRGATYVGHDAGCVEVAPLVLPRHLLVAENRGAADGMLRVFARAADGTAGELVQELAIAGRVVTPPVTDGKRLAVATTERPVAIYDILERGDAPLKKIADLPGSQGSRLSCYLSFGGGGLWQADAGVRVFPAAALANKPQPIWQRFAGDVSLQSVQISAGRVIVVLRSPGHSGIVAACLEPTSGSPIWETRLGVPSGAPCTLAENANKVLLARRDGAIYHADIAAARGLVCCQPLASFATVEGSASGSVSSSLQPSSSGVRSLAISLLPLGERQGLVIGATAAAAIDVNTGKLLPYPLPGQPLCPSVTGGGGIFAVCQPGEIYFLSGRGDASDVQPFMPVVRPSTTVSWHLTTDAGNGPPRVVAARGRQLYSIAVQAEPAPHLGMLGVAELPAGSEGAVAVAGELACVVDRAGAVQTFILPELKSGPAWNLGSPPVWGPQTAGPLILVATADGQLHAIDPRQRQTCWKAMLPQSDVVGAWAGDAKVLVACRDGSLIQLALDSGAPSANARLGEPLSAGPFVAGQSLLFLSAEGALLKAEAP